MTIFVHIQKNGIDLFYFLDQGMTVEITKESFHLNCISYNFVLFEFGKDFLKIYKR